MAMIWKYSLIALCLVVSAIASYENQANIENAFALLFHYQGDEQGECSQEFQKASDAVYSLYVNEVINASSLTIENIQSIESSVSSERVGLRKKTSNVQCSIPIEASPTTGEARYIKLQGCNVEMDTTSNDYALVDRILEDEVVDTKHHETTAFALGSSDNEHRDLTNLCQKKQCSNGIAYICMYCASKASMCPFNCGSNLNSDETLPEDRMLGSVDSHVYDEESNSLDGPGIETVSAFYEYVKSSVSGRCQSALLDMSYQVVPLTARFGQ